MSVRPAPSPRGRTHAVIGTGFLTHYAYAYTHHVTCFAFLPYFTVGSMTYEFLFYMLLNLSGGWWVLYSIADKSVCSVTTGERGSNPPGAGG